MPQYGRFPVAPANFLDWRQQNTVFARVIAYSGDTATIDAGTGPDRVTGATVSWDTFEMLGVSPALGRGFRQDEDAPCKTGVVVLSHGPARRGGAGVLSARAARDARGSHHRDASPVRAATGSRRAN